MNMSSITKKVTTLAASIAMTAGFTVAGVTGTSTVANADPVNCVFCNFPPDPPTDVGVSCDFGLKTYGHVTIFIKNVTGDMSYGPADAADAFGFDNAGEFNKFAIANNCSTN